MLVSAPFVLREDVDGSWGEGNDVGRLICDGTRTPSLERRREEIVTGRNVAKTYA